MADNVLADVIPCEVLLPTGELVRHARVWITDDGVAVFSESPPGHVRHVFGSRHVAPPAVADTRLPRRRQTHVCETEQGRVTVNPVSGCLCGFPSLRSATLDGARAMVRAGKIG